MVKTTNQKGFSTIKFEDPRFRNQKKTIIFNISHHLEDDDLQFFAPFFDDDRSGPPLVVSGMIHSDVSFPLQGSGPNGPKTDGRLLRCVFYEKRRYLVDGLEHEFYFP